MSSRLLVRHVMRYGSRLSAVVAGSAILMPTGYDVATAQAVRAVLFFSPMCPHCEQVITRDLSVFFQAHGGPPTVSVEEGVPGPERTFILLSAPGLEVLLVNTIRPAGVAMYHASLESHPTAEERHGVPRFVMGDTVLVGSVEIPTHFERIAAEASRYGALEWPRIDGLESALSGLAPLTVVAAAPADTAEEPRAADAAAGALPENAPPERTTPADTAPRPPSQLPRAEPTGDPGTGAASPDTFAARVPEPSEPTPAADRSDRAERAGPERREADADQAIPFETVARGPRSLLETFRRDLSGNILSVVVLFGMLASLGAVFVAARPRSVVGRFDSAVVPIAVVGVVVAGYLTYVEASGATAVCGPVGDCNTVQQSEYATLFGAIPVGALGLLGYVTMITAWLIGRRASPPARDQARVALFALALVGTIFSTYLTFLEPFVIGATCAWCLTSSVVVTALLWLSAGPGMAAWGRMRGTARP